MLSVDLLRMSVMCSILIYAARSFIGAYLRPITLLGRCFASVGKFGISSLAFLAALLSNLSIVTSCLSVNIPRWSSRVLRSEQLVYPLFSLIGE